jgi:hypothetical protein
VRNHAAAVRGWVRWVGVGRWHGYHSRALLVSILKPSSCSSARHPTPIVCASREMQSCVRGAINGDDHTRGGVLHPPLLPSCHGHSATSKRLGGEWVGVHGIDVALIVVRGQAMARGCPLVICVALLARALHAVDALAWMGRALTTASSSPPSTSPSGTACSHGRRYQARKGDQGARPYRLAGWLHPGETGPTAYTHAVMLVHRKGFSPFCALGTAHPCILTACVVRPQ